MDVIIPMQPPTAIGGWDLEFLAMRRFGNTSGMLRKSAASGYGNGVSGITILNSGQGLLQVSIWSADTSGWDFSNYAYMLARLSSGFRTDLTAGYMGIVPTR